MKNKAPLALMEQLVMLLVFALAAALCLQAFVLSDQMSGRCEERDRAVTAVQNAAETLKSCGGDLDAGVRILGGTSAGGQWQIGYDADWKQTAVDQAAYQVLVVLKPTEEPLLGSAEVLAQTVEGRQLFQLAVSWQEVEPHG